MARNLLRQKDSHKYVSGLLPEAHSPPKHDELGFYYSKPISIEPRSEISLTCDLWHHSLHQEEFTVRVVPVTTAHTVMGQVICRINAEILSNPKIATFPLEINPQKVSTMQLAFSWFTSHDDSEQ